MAKTMFSERPEAICYMPLPLCGKADIWLRKNIEQTTDDDGNAVWTADEVYFRTETTRNEVEKNFDEFFNNFSGNNEKPTLEDRITALEKGLAAFKILLGRG